MQDYDFLTHTGAGNSPASSFPEIQSLFKTILSAHNGATEPAMTFPFMLWADTGNNRWKRRNAADSGWVDMGPLGETSFGLGRGYIDGLGLANNTTDPDHDIDIAAGAATLKDGTGNFRTFVLTAGLTKQIDAAWSEGGSAGGFPSNLTLASGTEYKVFLIGTDDGSADAGFDTDASASNLLAGSVDYSWFRRIGSVFTDESSNVVRFKQVGDEFYYDFPVADIEDESVTSDTAKIGTIPAPPYSAALLTLTVESTASTQIRANASHGDVVPTVDYFNSAVRYQDQEQSTKRMSARMTVPVNAASQIRYIGSISGGSAVLDKIIVSVEGWRDQRGRND